MRFYHAPNAKKGRTEWTPNMQRFQQFLQEPEFLENLHFAFLVTESARACSYYSVNRYSSFEKLAVQMYSRVSQVLMRAVHKARATLLQLDYSSGDVTESACACGYYLSWEIRIRKVSHFGCSTWLYQSVFGILSCDYGCSGL